MSRKKPTSESEKPNKRKTNSAASRNKKNTRKLKKHEVSRYVIYTDGSFRKPCYGAWATILLDDEFDELNTLSGHEFDTTISRMELTAIIKGLEAIPDEVAKVIIISDSLYAVMSIMVWINYWKSSGWKTSSGGRVKNVDLMERLYEFKNRFMIKAMHVKSHTGENPYNDAVDKICSQLTLDMVSGKIKRPDEEGSDTSSDKSGKKKSRNPSRIDLSLPKDLAEQLNASYHRNQRK